MKNQTNNCCPKCPNSRFPFPVEASCSCPCHQEEVNCVYKCSNCKICPKKSNPFGDFVKNANKEELGELAHQANQDQREIYMNFHDYIYKPKIVEMLEGMKFIDPILEGKGSEFSTPRDYRDRGYNQALSDIIEKLKI